MTITPEAVKVGNEYTRVELAKIFGEPNLTTSREGYFGRDGQSYIPFFVTLDKEEADPSLAYNDYFDDGLFFWETQRSNSLKSKWIQKIINKELIPLLFVRKVAKIRNKTLPFVYAGRLLAPVPNEATSKPVKFVYELGDINDQPPSNLVELLDWKPSGARFLEPSADYLSKINSKRRTARSKGQGLETDPRVRKAIEMCAMDVAMMTYKQRGYDVEDVSGNHPYDLICTDASGRGRRVEVKGTRGSPELVVLTIGEVLAAREASATTDLFIVHGIVVETIDGEPKARGGKVLEVHEWVPLDKDLDATQFRYRVPIQELG